MKVSTINEERFLIDKGTDTNRMSRTSWGEESYIKVNAKLSRHNLRVIGGDDELNQTLEKANRVSDFLEIAELMCIDALDRTESCGGHFRMESQTDEGEAKRDDTHFSYTAAWEWKGPGKAPALHKEPLTFEYVPLSQRSYK